MRVGFGLPQLGPAAGPEAAVKVAQRAEALGYASVWVIERLLYPLRPQTPYPGTLKAIWTTDPVEFQRKFFRVPRSTIQSKPIQRPHLPIYLAAYAPSALKRAATLANGWNPTGLPLYALRQMTAGLKQMAQAAGRDAASVGVIVRANINVTEKPLGKDRPVFAGSLEQIKEDAAAVQQLGVDEIILDPIFSPDVRSDQDFLTVMEWLRSVV